jgi:hypothetical protein
MVAVRWAQMIMIWEFKYIQDINATRVPNDP